MKKILVEINKLNINQLDFFKSHFFLYPEILETIDQKLIISLGIDPIKFDLFSDFCRLNSIDFVYLEKFSAPFKLCLFDMDSTIISIECIDELADLFGKKYDVSKITELSMKGEIDFYKSFKQRLALLGGAHINLLDEVITERIRINPGVNRWMEYCQKNNITTVLVSSGFSYFTDYLKKLLNIDYSYSNQLMIKENILTGDIVGDIFGPKEKARIAEKYQKELNITTIQTITIGDGANDLLMMQKSSLSIGYQAKSIVKEKAFWNITYGNFNTITNFFDYLF